MASGVQLPDILDIGGLAVETIIPAEEAILHSWLGICNENVPAGVVLPESQLQADAISPAEEALLAGWLIGNKDSTAAGSKMQPQSASLQHGCSATRQDYSQPAQGLGGNPPPASIHESPVHKLSGASTIEPLCHPEEAGQTSSDGLDDVDQLYAMLYGDSPRRGGKQQAGHDPGVQSCAPPFPLSQPTGESPDSVQSASVACGFFSRQPVSADRQPQGHHLQGHYQEPCQEQPQQYRWQQGQGQYPAGPYQEPCQEKFQWQQGQGQYPEEPYQEAQPSQEQLWRQSMAHLPHRSSPLWGGSYTHEGPQDTRGQPHMLAAAQVAAPFLHPLDPWLSNASSASHASLQHDASGEFTPQTQPRMLGQRFSQGLGLAPRAAVLSTVGCLVPLASGSVQKRKAHEDQVNQDALDDLDEAAVAEILADPFTALSASGACWTDIAANSTGAACAYGQHVQLGHVAHMAQMQAAETKRPEKKQKTGHSSASSRSVYRAPAAARPSRRTHVRGAQLRQSPLQGTGAMLQPTPRLQRTPTVQPTSRLHPQAQSKPQRLPKDQAGPQAQSKSRLGATPSNSVATQRGAPAATRRGAPTATRRTAQAAARAAARTAALAAPLAAARTTALAAPLAAAPAAPPAVAPAAALAAAAAATPAAPPAAAPTQGSRYQVGQVVWARCGKSPWWPATVQKPTRAQRKETNMGSGPDQVFVVYHGTGQIQALPKNKVAHWGTRGIPSTGTRNLLKAVQSAQQAVSRRGGY